MKTLEQARIEFQRAIQNDGTHCPCCRRWGKINAYQITSTHVRGMIWMLKNFNRNAWIDLGKAPRWVLRAKTMSTLQHWGLIEHKAKKQDEDKRASGLWRLTPLGRDFVYNRGSVPKYVYVFNNRIVDLSSQQVDVISALKKKFSYEELMATQYKGAV